MEKNLINPQEINETLFSRYVEQLIVQKNQIIALLQSELKRYTSEPNLNLPASFQKIEEENCALKNRLAQLSNAKDSQNELLQKLIELENSVRELNSENSYLKSQIQVLENQKKVVSKICATATKHSLSFPAERPQPQVPSAESQQITTLPSPPLAPLNQPSQSYEQPLPTSRDRQFIPEIIFQDPKVRDACIPREPGRAEAAKARDACMPREPGRAEAAKPESSKGETTDGCMPPEPKIGEVPTPDVKPKDVSKTQIAANLPGLPTECFKEFPSIPSSLAILGYFRSLWLINSKRTQYRFSPFVHFSAQKQFGYFGCSFLPTRKIKPSFRAIPLVLIKKRICPLTTSEKSRQPKDGIHHVRGQKNDLLQPFQIQLSMVSLGQKWFPIQRLLLPQLPPLSSAFTSELKQRFIRQNFSIYGNSFDFFVSFLFNTIQQKFMKQALRIPILIHSLYVSRSVKSWEFFSNKQIRPTPLGKQFQSSPEKKFMHKLLPREKFLIEIPEFPIDKLMQSVEESLDSISSRIDQATEKFSKEDKKNSSNKKPRFPQEGL